jgi:uncharacterized membrane protein YphA (DoxX/SURF4 family)
MASKDEILNDIENIITSIALIGLGMIFMRSGMAKLMAASGGSKGGGAIGAIF